MPAIHSTALFLAQWFDYTIFMYPETEFMYAEPTEDPLFNKCKSAIFTTLGTGF